jgi:hypothetical protein
MVTEVFHYDSANISTQRFVTRMQVNKPVLRLNSSVVVEFGNAYTVLDNLEASILPPLGSTMRMFGERVKWSSSS